ncbi:MAG TPA: LuxR C-terminal-related transcriptional regulator [Prolixibacteraceae bacterium]|nr:LuxR C-terminal-related transcriptional regulator [Prolixibacteraceae bacterium]
MTGNGRNANRVIGIVEASCIVYEGLSTLLLKQGKYIQVARIDDLSELPLFIKMNHPQLIIINPSQIQNREKAFLSLRKDFPGKMIALVYSYFDAKLLSRFDGLIRITDSFDSIGQNLSLLMDAEPATDEFVPGELLSERETEVLAFIAKGLSNKEIAEKLFISIHTVNTHRKNIVHKTGIRSQAGLTIYALSNNIVTLGSQNT